MTYTLFDMASVLLSGLALGWVGGCIFAINLVYHKHGWRPRR